MSHNPLSCKIIRSKRKTAAFTVTRQGEVLLRIPLWMSEKDAACLIESNQEKLRSLVARWERANAAKPDYREEDIPKLKALATARLPERVDYWSEKMGLSPTSLKITSAKGRFGSCNSRGGICISCFLMLYPDDAIDYVLVHELAHLKYMNHSPEFYRLIAKYIPDYKKREAILKGRTTL